MSQSYESKRQDVRVLVVDHEQVSRQAVGNVLLQCGFKVSFASGGNEAVNALQQRPIAFDIILTEMMMPWISGVQLVQIVRSNRTFNAIPVVVMSASDDKKMITACLTSGAAEFISKPITELKVHNLESHVASSIVTTGAKLFLPNLPSQFLENFESSTGNQTVSENSQSFAECYSRSLTWNEGGSSGVHNQFANQKQQQQQPSERLFSSIGVLQNEVSQLGSDQNQGVSMNSSFPSLGKQPAVSAKMNDGDMSGRLSRLREPLRRNSEIEEHGRLDGPELRIPKTGSVGTNMNTGYFSMPIRPLDIPAANKIFDYPKLLEKDKLRKPDSDIAMEGMAFEGSRPEMKLQNAVESTVAKVDFASMSEQERNEHIQKTLRMNMAKFEASVEYHKGRRAQTGNDREFGNISRLISLQSAEVKDEKDSRAPDTVWMNLNRPNIVTSDQALNRDGKGFWEMGLVTGADEKRQSPDLENMPGESQRFKADKIAENERLRRELAKMEDLQLSDTEKDSKVAAERSSGATSLRNWIGRSSQQINRSENLVIFRNIVRFLDGVHSQGKFCGRVRPSSFIVTPEMEVQFVGSEGEGSGAEVEDNEQTWYISPEEVANNAPVMSSDIYCLGVLFFELFNSFPSAEAKAAAMMDMRHRFLPRRMLLDFKKESMFCRSLLHPDPASRPTTQDILSSALLKGLTEEPAKSVVTSTETEEDSELLLNFLLQTKKLKELNVQEIAGNLARLRADISEIERRRAALAGKSSLGQSSPDRAVAKGAEAGTSVDSDLVVPKKRKVNEELSAHWAGLSSVEKEEEEAVPKGGQSVHYFKQLENAYFSTRWKAQGADSAEGGTEQEGRSSENASDRKDSLESFAENLVEFSRYKQFKVRANLRHGSSLSTSNMVCSLGFDRDDEYLAAAGVCNKIKIFNCEAVLRNSSMVHFSVSEMASKSKLSSLCWNPYIKNQMAATDYSGTVQLWDVSTSQPISDFSEHKKRAWSVDFSKIDPTRMASGSDDCSVKIWSISERKSLLTLENKSNVCCVQFLPDAAHLLAFGSSDYKTYFYDLRYPKAAFYILAGHRKAVSYVRFLDPMTVVTASTDNSLKRWDLKGFRGSHTEFFSDWSVEYKGHSNLKNFVGLSVKDGYIACGSETNEVVVYHKSFPMPMFSHRFKAANLLTGSESTDDDPSHFVSAVCWRGKSRMVVAANSVGNIKFLEVV